MGVGGQRHAPAALPPGKTRYPLYRKEAGWAPRTVWTGAEKPLPPGFYLRTVQSVASRYTDCGIPTHNNILLVIKFKLSFIKVLA